MTSTGCCGAVDGPPIGMVAQRPQRPAGQKRFSFRKKKGSFSDARRIIGEAEGEDDGSGEPIIPTDAKEIDVDVEVNPDAEGDEPQDDPGELINPSAALVAPDVTPDAMKPLDPSMVPPPKHDPAVGVVLGQTPGQAQFPAQPGQSVPQAPPPPTPPSPSVNPSSPMESISWKMMTGSSTPGATIMERTSALPGIPPISALGESQAPTGDAVLATGAPMPAPEAPQPGRVIDAFRRFVR